MLWDSPSVFPFFQADIFAAQPTIPAFCLSLDVLRPRLHSAFLSSSSLFFPFLFVSVFFFSLFFSLLFRLCLFSQIPSCCFLPPLSFLCDYDHIILSPILVFCSLCRIWDSHSSSLISLFSFVLGLSRGLK